MDCLGMLFGFGCQMAENFAVILAGLKKWDTKASLTSLTSETFMNGFFGKFSEANKS